RCASVHPKRRPSACDQVQRGDPAKSMNLVLFDDALKHIMRISRIIQLPCASAMLAGVGGSGKQSLTHLAGYIAPHKRFQITITKTYKILRFRGSSDSHSSVKPGYAGRTELSEAPRRSYRRDHARIFRLLSEDGRYVPTSIMTVSFFGPVPWLAACPQDHYDYGCRCGHCETSIA
ncbi:unnamed protein product, partial [Vitrella brassicaformis CCMP3155]